MAQTSAAWHRQCVWEASEAGRRISAVVDSAGGFAVTCVPWAGLVSRELEPGGQLREETIHGTVLRGLGFDDDYSLFDINHEYQLEALARIAKQSIVRTHTGNLQWTISSPTGWHRLVREADELRSNECSRSE